MTPGGKMPTDALTRTSDRLRELPANATVRWFDMAMSAKRNIAWSYVDVEITFDDGTHGSLLSIDHPGSDEPVDADSAPVLAVPYDAALYIDRDDDTGEVTAARLHRDGQAPVDAPNLAETIHSVELNSSVFTGRCWTVDAINTALAAWAHDTLKRPDLTFTFDAPYG